MKIEINVWVSTNRVGSETSDTIEVDIDDDLTPEEAEKELEEVAKEWMFNNIEWGYVRKE